MFYLGFDKVANDENHQTLKRTLNASLGGMAAGALLGTGLGARSATKDLAKAMKMTPTKLLKVVKETKTGKLFGKAISPRVVSTASKGLLAGTLLGAGAGYLTRKKEAKHTS